MATSLFEVLPAGFVYQPDFITEDEERALVAQMASMDFGLVTMRGVTAKRRVRQYGWRYSFESSRVSPGPELPDFLLPLRDRAARLAAVEPDALSEALVTEYPERAAIGWHRDAPMFGDVTGISLGTACRMRFRRGPARARETAELELAPRSVYVLSGAARWSWQHSIPTTKADRYSVTFRTLRSR